MSRGPWFPLLAVLMCTAGALVALQAAVVRQGKFRALEVAKQSSQSQQEAKTELESTQWRVSLLEQSREKTAAQLNQASLQLSHVEDHLRRLRADCERLKTAAIEMERLGKSSAEQRAAAAAELADLQNRIRQADQELAAAQRQAAAQEKSYSVVPYQGPNQTRRRPIYIECRDDQIVLQPEGIVLRETDFDGPMGPGNPLASAMRAQREYLQTNQKPGAEKEEPYPLLLVRPDGILAYYAARAALTSWGADFGYELVGQNWKLAYPPTDPQLAEVTERTLSEARLRQQQYVLSAPRSYGRNAGKVSFRASPTPGGGFVEDRSGMPRGTGGRSSNTRYGSAGRGVGSGQPGGLGSGGGDGTSLMGEGGEGGTYNPYAHLGAGTGSGGTVAGSPGMTGGGQGGGTSGAGGGAMTPSAMAGAGGDRQAGKGNQLGGDAARGSKSPQSNSVAGKSLPGGTAGGSWMQGGGQQPGGQQAGGQQASRNQFATAGQSYAQQNRQNNQSGGSPGGSPGQTGNSTTSGANQQASTSGQPGGEPADPSQSPSGPPQIPSVKASQKPAESLAKKRGRDWGLPDATHSSVAITRPVYMECRPDMLVILPEDGLGGKQVPLYENTQDSVEDLVSAVWNHMKIWGIAGKGLYWKPTLVMDVQPGGEQRFAELETLLHESGLDVKRRQRVANTPPTTTRR